MTVELRDGEQQYWVRDQGKHFPAAAKIAETEITPEPALKEGYPSPWEAWRIEVPSSGSDKPLEFTINTSLPSKIQLSFKAYFIPHDGNEAAPGQRIASR